MPKEGFGSINVRPDTKRRLVAIADLNRLPHVEAADVVVNGWDMLTPDQQRQCIQRTNRPEPKRRKIAA